MSYNYIRLLERTCMSNNATIGFLLILIFTVTSVLGFSQSKSTFSNIQFITSDEGLSQNEVTCIIQDQLGFLWIGTRGGLNRYDGHSFKVFQNEIGNQNSLINNSIEALYAAADGKIWIGSKSNGLSCYDPEYDNFVHFGEDDQFDKSISGNRIITISQSKEGDIWAGTWSNGINIINLPTGKIQQLLPEVKVNKIIHSPEGTVWAATSIGLLKISLDGKVLNQYELPNKQPFVDIIQELSSGKFLLGTWNLGLFEFDPIMEEFSNLNHPQNINAYDLFQESIQKVWIGSWGEGLSLFNPVDKSFEFYDIAKNNFKNVKELYKDVLCTYKDNMGTLWLGTNGGGLCKIDESNQQFNAIGSTSLSSPRGPAWSIYKDRDQITWLGTKGRNQIDFSSDGINFSTLKLPGINENERIALKKGIRSITQSQDGSIWAASNFGLHKINKLNGNYEINKVDLLLHGENQLEQPMQISKLYETSDGTFWIGYQQDGLKKSVKPGNPQTQSFKSYHLSEEVGALKSNRISALLEDRTGQFWVGTYGGLHLYRPGNDDFIHYSKRIGDIQSLSSDIILCLHEDVKGNLWIGTPNGLNLAIPGIDQTLSFYCFQQKDGLPNNYIHAILEDEQGNLWISSNKGISKFNTQEKVFNNYDVNNGLQTNTFMEDVAFADIEGKFYFGSINGITAFHPDSIHHKLKTPPVYFTDFRIFNEPINLGDKVYKKTILHKSIEYNNEIELTHQQNFFSIEYTALNFNSSIQRSFIYRMNGLEEGWNPGGVKKNITYTNLNPGKYEFQVKVADGGDSDELTMSSLLITVLPPFWATWPAFILYVFIFIGLMLLYSHIISQQNTLKTQLELSKLVHEKDTEMASMKTRFFTNITHELRTPLTLITGPLEKLIDDNKTEGKIKDYLMIMHHHSQRLLNLVNQLLDFRKAESGQMKLQVARGNIVQFSKEVFLSFRELAEQKSIEYKFHTDLEKISLYFDREKMEIVLCNLLSNAFKYSRSNSLIELTIKVKSGAEFEGSKYCEIAIKDNGNGMPQDLVEKIFDRFYQISNTHSVKMVGTGIGLALAKNIVDLHHGKIQVKSKLNLGSEFRILLSFGKNQYTADQIIQDFKNAEHSSHYSHHSLPLKEPIEIKKQQFSPARNLKMLVVEDNAGIRQFIKKIFEEHYLIYEAQHGEEGLLKAKEIEPDIILSDILMPKMDGLAFCASIKENPSTAHIPVILLTSRSSNVFQIKGYNSGADIYVIKPFNPKVLKAQVKNLLESKTKLKDYYRKNIILEPAEIEITSLDTQFLEKLMQLVEDNLNNEKLNREFIAQRMSMSSSTLYRKLKSVTGYNTNAFIRSIRLKRAAQYILKSEYHISEIAYKVGFNDLKYFRTCFKAQFGVVPSKFTKDDSSQKVH